MKPTIQSKRMEIVTPFHVMRLMEMAHALERAGKHIVHMEVGEPDFETPGPIIRAANAYLKKGHVHYTAAAGLPELRRKIAEHYAVRFDVAVDPDCIFITPGASGALSVALAAVLDPGDQILVTDPGYPCNANLIRLYGGDPKAVAVSPEKNYQFSLHVLEKHWQADTRGILMASPSNPTGTLMPLTELQLIIDWLRSKDAVLIADEIYQGLVYDHTPTSVLQWEPQAIIVNSFSKYFGMTGWRLGWLVVPPALREAANRLIQNLFISAPTHSQVAALAAFDAETMAILESRRKTFQQRRDRLKTGLQQIGFKFPAAPEGAFYLYADCSMFTHDSESLALDILNRAHVAITPGLDFGETGAKSHLRFAYTTSIDEIELGLERLAVFFKNA